MEGRIVVLTGPLSAGKTTLGKALCRKNDFAFIGDISSEEPSLSGTDILRIKAKRVLEIQGYKKEATEKQDIKSLRTLDEAFLDYDSYKELYAKSLKEKGKISILEKNHIRTLEYSYAMMKREASENFPKLLSKYLSRKDEFVVPDAYIELEVDKKTSLERQEKRGDRYDWLNNIWNDNQFLNDCQTFFNFFSQAYEAVPVFRIDSSRPKNESISNMEDIIRRI
jgi:deoxyadenosine/deoxycytidine kinase